MLDHKLEGRRVCVCVTGGIACFKTASLVSMLVKAGADVSVAMTKNAQKFISPITFEALCHNAVVTEMFSRSTPYEVEHVAFAKKAEVMVVAPATANIIAKAAMGIADDFVSTTLLATKAPTLFAPAMNTNMYNNPIFKDNMKKLIGYGKFFISPKNGFLACGDVGDGRMAEPEEIFNEICDILNYPVKDFAGKNLLITAGPTIERIDDVRYITNRSSGKMGYAIAHAAHARGANVTLISGKTTLSAPKGVNVINIESAKDMLRAVMDNFISSDIIIKAAAVADYTPAKKVDGKIKKGEDMSLELKRTQDILFELGNIKEDRILVGFAAEAQDVLTNAKSKLNRKNLDMIAANDISRSDIGFGGEENALTLLFKDGRKEHVEKCSKEKAANVLLDAILTIKEN